MMASSRGERSSRLKVLDDRDLEGGLVVDLLDERWNHVQAGALGRSPATLAGDQLVVAVGLWSDEKRAGERRAP